MSRALIAAFLLVVIATMPTPAQETVVPLPDGETPLGDIGLYRVAYQSYGGDVVEMPPSWIGHFETVSGVSYLPGEQVLGRSAILLHSPWRVPPGKAWVDYVLRLPDTTPIVLAFGIAMRPDVMEPGKSDGVTFSAYVVDGGRRRELLREHCAKAVWTDHSFDLSDYAGRTVTLRLQTEPGPDNSPSFDYSYFGDPRITVGTGPRGPEALIERLTSTAAYRATAEADLRALSNRSAQGIAPSNLLDYENTVERAGEAYRFSYQGADCRIVYTYEPRTGTLDDFTVQVDDGQPFLPAAGGGATLVAEGDGEPRSLPARDGRLVGATLRDGDKAVEAVWEYDAAGRAARIIWTFGITAKALTVTAACQTPSVTAFSLGQVGGAPLRRTLHVPYLPADWSRGVVHYLSAQNVFVLRYLDWTVSHASRCPQGEATYSPRTDGTRNPLFESGYVAVSPSVNEVLPNIPWPASPYLDLLGPRIMLDLWAHHQGTYQGDAENLRALKDNGVDHLAIISHVWQRYGYDVKLPDHLPANPQFGGDEGMIEFGNAARECGYVWSLHENYIDLYPDAPSYDPSARVLLADGSPSKAFFNAGTGVQSFGLKCNRALGYASQNSPEIHRRFGTTAAYLDVHTCVPPWHQLDHEAGQPMAAMAHAKVQYDSELFQFMRDTHEGPLFGEGANHFYWAGLVDGVEAQVSGGENHAPFLDFDLLKLHPQMVNHGMGYYERWFTRGYDHVLGLDTGTPEQVDKYRAQELAYGHAGFIGSSQTANIQWVAKEHHLMHPVQRLYGAARPISIEYELDGRFVSGSVALILGRPWRQRIRYETGLTLWVNWAQEPWLVEGRTLPQWGFLALGPETQVCTELRDGRFADYADCPAYLFVDARTYFDMPYLSAPRDIEPRLREWKYIGDGKLRVTYEWIVGEALDGDYHCFVHFLNAAADTPSDIVFQQDHEVPTPTSQWRPGDVIADGPYEIQVPADEFGSYDLVIGLHRGPRVPLKGVRASEGRIVLGRLRLTREGGRITDIVVEDLGPEEDVFQGLQADFTAHLNPPGTMLDFGKVATDGSVKIEKSEGSLTALPYPREKAFTVSLAPGEILPGARIEPARIQVRALAAGTGADLGPVEATVRDGRVTFPVGMAGAGRYVITW